MTVYVVTCNYIEGEGEVEMVGVFAHLDAARAARRKHAQEDVQGEDVTDDMERWDLCGDMVTYEIHTVEVIGLQPWETPHSLNPPKDWTR